MSAPIFVTGIGTDVGKTLVSALLVRKFGFDYWKPIQAGGLAQPDREFVKRFSGRDAVTYFPERYFFKNPVSPHWAAELDGISVSTQDWTLPPSKNLLIEGAGGLMVPITPDFLVLDLIKQFRARVVLVCDHYLGSINHTLLSLQLLRNEGIPIAGLVFNHAPHIPSEQVILHRFPLPVLVRVPEFAEFTPQVIQQFVDDTEFATI